jgi:hypothetical protein
MNRKTEDRAFWIFLLVIVVIVLVSVWTWRSFDATTDDGQRLHCYGSFGRFSCRILTR